MNVPDERGLKPRHRQGHHPRLLRPGEMNVPDERGLKPTEGPQVEVSSADEHGEMNVPDERGLKPDARAG